MVNARLSSQEINGLMPNVRGWRYVIENGKDKLKYDFGFASSMDAERFIEDVRSLGEKENHHPIIETEDDKITITWWSADVDGLTEQDFTMAVMTDGIYSEYATIDPVDEASKNSFPASDPPQFDTEDRNS